MSGKKIGNAALQCASSSSSFLSCSSSPCSVSSSTRKGEEEEKEEEEEEEDSFAVVLGGRGRSRNSWRAGTLAAGPRTRRRRQGSAGGLAWVAEVGVDVRHRGPVFAVFLE